MTVGSTPAERLAWLKNKRAEWDADKLVHELGGRNRDAWLEIVGTHDTEVTGAVLEFLSSSELLNDASAAPLYEPFLSGSGAAALRQYTTYGPISDMGVEEAAMDAPGGPVRQAAVNHAISLLRVMHNMCIRLPEVAATSPELKMLAKQMDGVVEALRPPPEQATPVALAAQLTEMKQLLESIASFQRSAMELRRAEMKREQESRAADVEAAAARPSRNRSGIATLDDPARDADYLLAKVVPSPEELIGDGPTALPANLVTRSRHGVFAIATAGNRAAEGEEGDEAGEGALAGAGAASMVSVAPLPRVPRYRGLNHLLNTHYQLLRHDCLAGLRKAIHAFRDRVKGEGGINTPGALDRAVKASAHMRGDVRVTAYNNVRVLRMEQSRHAGITYVIGFNVPKGVNVDWSHSSRLMNGSLLCISYDGSFEPESCVLATVAQTVKPPTTYNSRFQWAPTISLAIEADSVQRFNRYFMGIQGSAAPSGGAGGAGAGGATCPALAFDPVMIESPVFFEAYTHVLHALQRLGKAPLPFSRLLLGESHEVAPPAYLVRSGADELGEARRLREGRAAPGPVSFGVRPEEELSTSSSAAASSLAAAVASAPSLAAALAAARTSQSLALSASSQTASGQTALRRDAGWHMAGVFPSYTRNGGYWDCRTTKRLLEFDSEPALDESQRRAVEVALSQQVSLIQGPPGCGKTFVGVLIARLLLRNAHLRARKPVLFVCQTNHALDQMLSHVRKYTSSLIRVGGRCTDPALESCNLRVVMDNGARFNKYTPEEFKALDDKQLAFQGLQAAFAQRRSVSVRPPTGQPVSVPSNVSLLRLHTLLGAFGKLDWVLSGSNPVDQLLDSAAPSESRDAAWQAVSTVAKARAVAYRLQRPPSWAVIDSLWFGEDAQGRLAKLAAFPEAADLKPNGTEPELVRAWCMAKPRRQNRRQAASDDWQTVSSALQPTDQGSAPAFDAGISDSLSPSAILEEDADREERERMMLDDDQADFEDLQDMFDADRGKRADRLTREIDDAAKLGTRQCSEDRISSLIKSAGFTTQEQTELRRGMQADLTTMSSLERISLAALWARLLCADADASVWGLRSKYDEAHEVLKKADARHSAEVLEKAEVVGMTTTGAAKHAALLRELGPEVILVEEAAEVLEAHVLASFNASLKHLVLIGDHLQLRPQVAEYDLVHNHALDISLFERLVRAEVPYATLSTQRRMHPSISSFIRPLYPALLDAPATASHPMPPGMSKRVFFWSHTVPEDGETVAFGSSDDSAALARRAAAATGSTNDQSKRNSYEAALVIGLLKYLLLNGTKASRIVVLTMYKGQLMLLKRLAQQEKLPITSASGSTDYDLSGVRMTTVDNYQGEENDVVLLSTVRSNLVKQVGVIGFLSAPNRTNVALSRARNAMYVVGNLQLLASRSDLWKDVYQRAEERGDLGTELTLRCSRHASDDDGGIVRTPEDFKTVAPLGGCRLPCGQTRDCGHMCPLQCHPLSHSDINCMMPCKRDQPCGHPCRKRCWESCSPCPVPMERTRESCGHKFSLACGLDPEDVVCPGRCKELMTCGHTCDAKCHVPHPADTKCFKGCVRPRACGHPCPKKCWEACGACMAPVKRELPCGHTVEMPCSVDVSTAVCKAPCKKMLRCGHPCQRKCSEPCTTDCTVAVAKPLLMCLAPKKHFMVVQCSADLSRHLCREKCNLPLACGHACGGSCCDCNTDDSGKVGHAVCSAPCPRRCAHGPCDRRCGDFCKPCAAPCNWACEHRQCKSQCKSRCGQPHVLEDGICSLPCPRLLPCGHPCGGLCGEVCPGFCPTCAPAAASARLRVSAYALLDGEAAEALAMADPSSVRFVQLACGHIFAADILGALIDGWLAEEHQRPHGRVLTCPDCDTPLHGVYRHDPAIASIERMYLPQKLAALSKEAQATVSNLLAAGMATQAAARMRLAIQRSADEGEGGKRLQPLHHLLLGQALSASNDKRGAVTALNVARASTDSAPLCAEAYWSIALAHLGFGLQNSGIQPALLELSSNHDLESAKVALQKAVEIAASPGYEASDSMFRAQHDIASNAAALHQRVQTVLADRQRRQEELARQQAEAVTRQRAAAARQAAAAVEQGAQAAAAAQAADDAAAAQRAAVQDAVLQQVKSRRGTELHLLAVLGRQADIEKALKRGQEPRLVDSFGETALHVAARNRNAGAVRALLPHCNWAAVNQNGESALELALLNLDAAPRAAAPAAGSGAASASTTLTPPPKWNDETANVVRGALAAKPAGGKPEEPEKEWARRRLEAVTRGLPPPSSAMDELMSMTGLRAVKTEALKFYKNVQLDMSRPPEARTLSRQALNFTFLGNPGSGKTTVARIFARLLKELGVREGDALVERTGQALLDAGSSKFDDTLKAATPGVLFIDEVYQLNPAVNAEGRAVTNKVLAAAEDSRGSLTFIVAGYKRDVEEQWMGSNPGLTSRFPFRLEFEDYNEGELRAIFLSMVAAANWRLEANSAGGADVATIAARRLARGRNTRGFANGRSVRLMLETAQRRASDRITRLQETSSRALTAEEMVTLTRADVLGSAVNPDDIASIKQLDAMPGLTSVKRALKSLLNMAVENFKRELEGKPVQEVALHKLFLGNPGTGKTTVAKVYGEALREIGLLSDGSVELVGASRLIGDVVGSAPMAVNSLLDRSKGKVVVIDEAYVLARSPYGKEALDTLVERVQGTPGEDMAVLLLGYNDEMRAMLRDCNPGLARRFKENDAFIFEDYDNEQLTAIMLKQATDRGLQLSPELALRAVVEVLAKERAKPHFGNAGAVKNLLDAAVQRMSARLEEARLTGGSQPRDLQLEASDLFDTRVVDPLAPLVDLINGDFIRNRIAALQKQVQVRRARGDTDSKKLLASMGGWCFAGPPGTGKTSAARAFGEVFKSLGLLADSRVVEVKATELVAGYVGQSSGLVKIKMDEARGGVLFIDEAYGLDYSAGAPMYAKDALETLLGNLTDPAYSGNMLVILAGYRPQLESLLACNPGMPRRFPEVLEFPAWEPHHCVELVQKQLQREGIELPAALHPRLQAGFAALAALPAFGNAGDAITVAAKIQAAWEFRYDEIEPGPAIEADVDNALQLLLVQRQSAAVAVAGRAQLAARAGAGAAFAQASSLAPLLPSAIRMAVAEAAADQEEREAVAEDPAPSPDSIFAALEAALVECGYDVEESLRIVSSRQFPDSLLQLVASKASSTPARVRPMLIAQCPQIQPRLEAAVAEVVRQREAEAAIARAAEAEREALRAAEAERRRIGAYICGVCGRAGCPVMPIWHSWNEGTAGPALRPYDGNNGPAVTGPAPRV